MTLLNVLSKDKRENLIKYHFYKIDSQRPKLTQVKRLKWIKLRELFITTFMKLKYQVQMYFTIKQYKFPNMPTTLFNPFSYCLQF